MLMVPSPGGVCFPGELLAASPNACLLAFAFGGIQNGTPVRSHATSRQYILHWNTLNIAIHLLPQVIAGIICSVLAANVLYKVSNKLIVAFSELKTVASNLFLTFNQAFNQADSLDWAYICVSDFQFNVTYMSFLSLFTKCCTQWGLFHGYIFYAVQTFLSGQ